MNRSSQDGLELTPIITHHDTRLYIDIATGALRHGSRGEGPDNVRLILRDGAAELVRWTGERALPIQFTDTISLEGAARSEGAPTSFRFEEQGGARFALRGGELYLSARGNGRVTLSCSECKTWEVFRGQSAPTRGLKVAAFTTVYNEALFLPLWLRHYGGQLGAENIYVLDNGSTDGSTDNLGAASVVKVPRFDPFDEVQRAEFVAKFQASLLCYYDAVIFADADEFLVPKPSKYTGLLDFISRRCEAFSTAVGVEVVHIVENEPSLDLTAPLLGQRRYAQFAAEYCKTLVSRVPLSWHPGFHACQYTPSIDHDLYMFHLKRMDYECALRQLLKSRSIVWSEEAKEKDHSFQIRYSDEELKAKLFGISRERAEESVVGDFNFEADLARIPDRPWSARYFRGAIAEIPDEFASGPAPLGRG